MPEVTAVRSRVRSRRPPPNIMWLALCIASAVLIWIGLGLAVEFGAWAGLPLFAVAAVCAKFAFDEDKKT